MDLLTVEQAWQNIVTAIGTFSGNREQWTLINASLDLVNGALFPPAEPVASDKPGG